MLSKTTVVRREKCTEEDFDATYTEVFLANVLSKSSAVFPGEKAAEVTGPGVRIHRAVLDVRRSHSLAVESSEPLSNNMEFPF